MARWSYINDLANQSLKSFLPDQFMKTNRKINITSPYFSILIMALIILLLVAFISFANFSNAQVLKNNVTAFNNNSIPFKMYENISAYGIRIQYPSNWLVDETADRVKFSPQLEHATYST